MLEDMSVFAGKQRKCNNYILILWIICGNIKQNYLSERAAIIYSYEYRSTALSEISGEKIIISMIITTKVVAYMADADAVPYAGYFIKVKEEARYNLRFAKQLLEAPEFYKYVKDVETRPQRHHIMYTAKRN